MQSVLLLKERAGTSPHTCFKNWDSSSGEMEADVIVEGFLQVEKTSGYMSITGDGYSSVMSTIREEVPVWGSDVRITEVH